MKSFNSLMFMKSALIIQLVLSPYVQARASYTHVEPQTEFAKRMQISNQNVTLNGNPVGNDTFPSSTSIDFTIHSVDQENSPYQNQNDQKAKYNVKTPQYVIGKTVASGTPSLSPKLKPSEIRKMFLEERASYAEQTQQRKQMMRSFGATAEWQKTIWGSTLKRFPTESLMFFVAIGVVNTANMLAKYSYNPLLMEQHLQTLTDPIGHLSFLAFMMANGYAHHYLDRPNLTTRYLKKDLEQIYAKSLNKLQKTGVSRAGAILEAEKYIDGKAISGLKLAYSQFIPYLSMTAGSMASHLVGDFYHTLNACVQSFTPEQNKVDAKKDALNGLSQDPCDVAWREWTVEKKFNVYAPALASMMLAQVLSTGVSIVNTKGEFFGIFEKAGSKGKVLNFKLLGFEIIKDLVPGRAAMRALRMVGHVSNLTMFTAIDQLIHHWVENIVLNVNYGKYNIMTKADAFPQKAEILYDLLSREEKEKYQNESSACKKDLQDYECQSGDILGYLHNFSETMTKWKDFNKTKALMAHQAWLQNVNNFQATEVATEAFYKEWLLDLQHTEYYRRNPLKPVVEIDPNLSAEEQKKVLLAEIQKKVDEGTLSDEDIRDVPPMTNYRAYPLFGIDPIEGIQGYDYSKWKNDYLEDPRRIEALQLAQVKKVVKEFKEYLGQKDLSLQKYKNEAEKLTTILQNLESEDSNKIGYAINLMRYYSENTQSGTSDAVRAIFRDFLDRLGSPTPLMSQGQGFSYGVESYSGFKDVFKNMVLPSFFSDLSLSTNIRFNKKSDYIYYHMLCGPTLDSADFTLITKKYYELFGINTHIHKGLQTLFIPPSIVNPEVKADLCEKSFGFKDSNEIYSIKIKDPKTNSEFKGIFSILFKNLHPDFKAMIEAMPKFEYAEGEEKFPEFAQWWEKKITPQVVAKLNEFKEDYHAIAVEFYKSLFKSDSELSEGIIKNSIVGATLQEARIYSMIAAHAIGSKLTEGEIKNFLASEQSSKPYKITYKRDIFTAQLNSFHQDFKALMNRSTPKVYKFQFYMEQMLRVYYENLKSIKIEKMKNSKGEEIEVVNTSLDELKIENISKEIDGYKIKMLEELGKISELLKAKEGNLKAVSILIYTQAQLERLSKEFTTTMDAINLMTQKVTEKTNKVVSKELQKARFERLKRERESANKDCRQRNVLLGASGECK